MGPACKGKRLSQIGERAKGDCETRPTQAVTVGTADKHLNMNNLCSFACTPCKHRSCRKRRQAASSWQSMETCRRLSSLPTAFIPTSGRWPLVFFALPVTENGLRPRRHTRQIFRFVPMRARASHFSWLALSRGKGTAFVASVYSLGSNCWLELGRSDCIRSAP